MELCRPAAGDWARLYRLYLRAFPRSERKPFAMIVKMYRRGVTDIWCIREGGRFAGLGITINGPDAVLLDYFAIEPKLRGRGLGARALMLIRQQYPDRGMFLEIESTLEQVPDLPMRRRRKAFYLRCGMEPMGVQVYLFGVKMELLGMDCVLTYPQYRDFYRDNYSPWAAEHIGPAEE